MLSHPRPQRIRPGACAGRGVFPARHHARLGARLWQQMSMESPSDWSTERRAFSFPPAIPPGYRKCSARSLRIRKLFESGGRRVNLTLSICVSSGSFERRWRFTQPPLTEFADNLQSALERQTERLSRPSMVCSIMMIRSNRCATSRPTGLASTSGTPRPPLG
jgi:hypothetical protein